MKMETLTVYGQKGIWYATAARMTTAIDLPAA